LLKALKARSFTKFTFSLFISVSSFSAQFIHPTFSVALQKAALTSGDEWFIRKSMFFKSSNVAISENIFKHDINTLSDGFSFIT